VRQPCPLCGNWLVEPVGPPSAPLLLLGEYPGWREAKEGRAWIGEAGQVLRAELARVGIQFDRCRATNLWLHNPSKEPGEYEYHMQNALNECKGRKAILLMGSDVSWAFLDRAVSDVSGLLVTSPLLTHDVKIVISKNPALLLRQGAVVGDVRHAFGVFGEVVKSCQF